VSLASASSSDARTAGGRYRSSSTNGDPTFGRSDLLPGFISSRQTDVRRPVECVNRELHARANQHTEGQVEGC
jgi:hypothetical protein